MAATIVVGTNSWTTLAEANTYFATRINNSRWEKLSSNDRKIFLISAFEQLDNDPAIIAPKTTTEAAVKKGQAEFAFFLIKYADDRERRDALISSGVKDFQYSKWQEELTEVVLPTIVRNFFSSVGFYVGSSAFALVDTDETDV